VFNGGRVVEEVEHQSGIVQEVVMNPTVPTQLIDSLSISKDSGEAKQMASVKYTRTEVAHFEDIQYNGQELCKKFVMCGVQTVPIQGNDATILRLSVADLLFPNGEGTSIPYNGNGWIGWLAPLYAAFRGDIRFKFQIQVQALEGSDDSISPMAMQLHGVVMFNPLPYGTSSIGSDLSLIQINAMLEGGSLRGLRAGMPQMTQFIITEAHPELVEFEIPYLQLGNFMKPTGYAPTSTAGEPYSLGEIAIIMQPCLLGLTSAPLGVDAIIKVFAAFGDAARFGVPYTIPTVTIARGLYPDFYPEMAKKKLGSQPIPIPRRHNTPVTSGDVSDDSSEFEVISKAARNKQIANMRARLVRNKL